MFKFLKEKLKGALSRFSKKVEEETEAEEAPKEETKKKPVSKEKKEVKKEQPPKQKAEKKKEIEAEEKIKPEKLEFPSEKEIKQIEKKVEEKEKQFQEEITEEKEKIAVKEEPPKEEEKEKGFFGRLKEKILSKEEEPKIEEPQIEPEIIDLKKESPKKVDKTEIKEAEEKPEEVFEKIEVPEELEEAEEEKEAEAEEEKEEVEEKEEKQGFFGKLKEAITKKALSESKFGELFWDLEVAMLENNIAVEVIDKIRDDLKKQLVEQKVLRGDIDSIVIKTLIKSLEDILDFEKIDLIQKIKKSGKKPFIIVFSGINGSGKTTTIAKIVKLLQDNKLKPVIAAADTFRAAAIQQLEEHAQKLGVKLIKQDYGSDPAAVAFDAIKYAEAKNMDVVLVDTAGRLHANVNLMDEMKKIIRVAKPDMNIFVGESITGNDCVEQARKFNEAVGIDAIILSKADVDEKGGAAISVSYVTGKPILYLGVGQGYDDLKEFNSDLVIEGLGLSG